VFSFKLRGAYNKMAHLTPEQLQKGVICASAGNHAQGVALGAHKLGCRAVIVMPTTTPQVKVDAVRALGGEVVLHGDSYSDAYEHALAAAGRAGPDLRAPVRRPRRDRRPGHHRHGDPAPAPGAAGRGVRGHRRRRADQRRGAYIKALRPEIKVIGVQMRDSDAMVQSVRPASACSWPTWACSPTAPPSSWWARRPSAWPRAGGRLRDRRHRRRVRRHQGRVPGHAQHRRAGRRHGRGRHQAVRGHAQAQGRDATWPSPAAPT
jgi:hypothetical protein